MIKRSLTVAAVLSLIVVGASQVDAAVHHVRKSSKAVPSLMTTPATKHKSTLSTKHSRKHTAKHSSKHAAKHSKRSVSKVHKKAL